MTRWLLVLTAGTWMAGTAMGAHHSLTEYDSSRQATVDGSVGQFQFVNPHPWLVLDVKDRSGAVQQWRLEMDNRHEMSDIGMSKDTLKPGDRLVVSGMPGHTQPRILYIHKLERPADGYGYEQAGSRPRLRLQSAVSSKAVRRTTDERALSRCGGSQAAQGSEAAGAH